MAFGVEAGHRPGPTHKEWSELQSIWFKSQIDDDLTTEL